MAKGYKGCEPKKDWFYSTNAEKFCNWEDYNKTMRARREQIVTHRGKFKDLRDFEKHIEHIKKLEDGYKLYNGLYVKLVKCN